MSSTELILGVNFFNGTVDEAVDTMSANGGLLVVPAAPALVKLSEDEEYRRALVSADMAIADSGAMVLLWKIFTGRHVERISGLKFLKRLVARLASHPDERVLWIHCIGAALAFLTGDQPPIPMWADRFYLGWLLRLLRQPRVFGPRYLSALKLPLLLLRNGRNLPPLRRPAAENG